MCATHACPVADCGKVVDSAKLMCWGCWKRVPCTLQREVYRTWRSGGSSEYNAARQAAIQAVNSQRSSDELAQK